MLNFDNTPVTILDSGTAPKKLDKIFSYFCLVF